MLMQNFLQKILVLTLVITLSASCQEKRIDYSTEVKPIINKRCIACHGGVKQNGGFSLLFRQDALDTVESGKRAIVPGDPGHSEMIRRLTLDDPEERMPYKEEPLSGEEIGILTKWIEQGAEWGDHWAYVPPQPVAIPSSRNLLSAFGAEEEEWVKNDIDHFILQKLEDQKLKPSPETDKATLIRRIYLDLIGIPPMQEEANAFITSSEPDAYEKVVDDLLASPHYGEKWASWWLDLARYSDTKGYERDGSRTIWRYRDWVIRALNEDKPFDQFTIEQLAGDMVENPSDELLVATAFHRNTMNNDEGGTDDEEFRTATVIDRVNTTYEVWQSTTIGCVQCHSHPYDPFRHEEYYKSLAFFNNASDEDVDGEHPNLRMYLKEEDQQKLESIKKWVNENSGPEKQTDVVKFLKTLEPKYHPHDFDQFVNGELIDGKWLGIRSGGSTRLKQIALDGKDQLIIYYWMNEPGGSFEIRTDGVKGDLIGQVNLEKTKGSKTISIPLKSVHGKHDLYFIFRNPRIKPDWSVCAIEWFAFRESLADKSKPGQAAMQTSFMHLLNADVDNTPVMIETSGEQKRETHVFERGNWMVKGKPVSPEVPRSLNDFPENFPANRLGFARWLVSTENPLTARTIANRLWEQIFGYGIVETLEDFGTQGAQPSHPELLDWLALRIMEENKWSLKKTLKDIVMSATYRQDSDISPEGLEKDQNNRWLSRAPRIRLSAEQIRDQALAVSGLLSKKMYGPGVMPYQPEGIWQSVYNGERWIKSKGEDQYRRAVYTFSKRTSPYPSLFMFDGSSREVCLSRRIRTDTPLQALVTLNDSAFVEASRFFARKMMAEGSSSGERIDAGYKALTFKSIAENKLNVLNGLYNEALKKYTANEEDCKKMIADKKAQPELAAMTVVANALLNLDEVIMKE
jgi:hypothetical protein